MTDRSGADRLVDTLAPAEAEAERHFGAGPATEWRPSAPGTWRRPSVRVVLATGLAALLATAAAAVAHWAPRDPVHLAEPMLAPQDPSDEPATEASLPSLAIAPSPTPSPAPALSITRQGRTWRIDAAGASRLAAAQTFAQLSGSPLRGSVAALAASRRLDLHWQGRDPARAWQALLGAEVSYALQCDAQRCQAWIVGGATAGHAAGGHETLLALAPRPLPYVPAPMPLPAAPTPLAAQADSPDPHIASHHD